MAEPEYVFTTIAFKYRPLMSAGFFCLWDDELTFVHSKYVQFLTAPLYQKSVPDRVKPTGPEDPRTRFRVPYADLIQVTKRGSMIRVHPRTGKDGRFGGGTLNRAFQFDAVTAEIAKALEAAGHTVNIADDVLTVHPAPG